MVIGLSGKIRSGKSRVAKIFKKVLEKEGKTCEIKSFASPIYEIVSELYRTDVKQIKKDKRDNLIVLMNNNKYNGSAGSDFFASSYREILQKIGTTARAMADITRDRTQMIADFKALKKNLKNIPKNLRKEAFDGYTYENVVRIYALNKQGESIPGLSKADWNSFMNSAEAEYKAKYSETETAQEPATEKDAV